jgi:hypothetical protein
MADEKRFVKTYNQGFWDRTMEIWVDKKTGVNYLVTQSGYSGGMTVLVDPYGKPIISRIPEEE